MNRTSFRVFVKFVIRLLLTSLAGTVLAAQLAETEVSVPKGT